MPHRWKSQVAAQLCFHDMKVSFIFRLDWVSKISKNADQTARYVLSDLPGYVHCLFISHQRALDILVYGLPPQQYMFNLSNCYCCSYSLGQKFGYNITFKAVERLHQDQWQFSCHQTWCKFTLIVYIELYIILFSFFVSSVSFHLAMTWRWTKCTVNSEIFTRVLFLRNAKFRENINLAKGWIDSVVYW